MKKNYISSKIPKKKSSYSTYNKDIKNNMITSSIKRLNSQQNINIVKVKFEGLVLNQHINNIREGNNSLSPAIKVKIKNIYPQNEVHMKTIVKTLLKSLMKKIVLESIGKNMLIKKRNYDDKNENNRCNSLVNIKTEPSVISKRSGSSCLFLEDFESYGKYNFFSSIQKPDALNRSVSFSGDFSKTSEHILYVYKVLAICFTEIFIEESALFSSLILYDLGLYMASSLNFYVDNMNLLIRHKKCIHMEYLTKQLCKPSKIPKLLNSNLKMSKHVYNNCKYNDKNRKKTVNFDFPLISKEYRAKRVPIFEIPPLFLVSSVISYDINEKKIKTFANIVKNTCEYSFSFICRSCLLVEEITIFPASFSDVALEVQMVKYPFFYLKKPEKLTSRNVQLYENNVDVNDLSNKLLFYESVPLNYFVSEYIINNHISGLLNAFKTVFNSVNNAPRNETTYLSGNKTTRNIVVIEK